MYIQLLLLQLGVMAAHPQLHLSFGTLLLSFVGSGFSGCVVNDHCPTGVLVLKFLLNLDEKDDGRNGSVNTNRQRRGDTRESNSKCIII
jgi:hypothetical protein